ncbi:MAG: hypothetical protein H6582_13175 [Crocinitomicaceae bacterium]|nr:hypothetical protein [Crocinitomicaceae bacterium]
MKKYFALTVVAAFLLAMSSFVHSSEDNDGEDDKVTNSEVWDYMHENVFKKLYTLVDYDGKKSFSRCPSGFGQYMDTDATTNDFVFGTITYAQGCDRDDYCLYKIDWNKKETFLRKSEKEAYVALDTFVKNNKVKTAKI